MHQKFYRTLNHCCPDDCSKRRDARKENPIQPAKASSRPLASDEDEARERVPPTPEDEIRRDGHDDKSLLDSDGQLNLQANPFEAVPVEARLVVRMNENSIEDDGADGHYATTNDGSPESNRRDEKCVVVVIQSFYDCHSTCR